MRPFSLPLASLALGTGLVGLAACRPASRDVEIIATNYAFQAPAILGSGPTLFHLTNHGTVTHEVQLFRFRRGVTPDSGMKLLVTEGTPDSLYDVNGSVLISAPGQTAVEGIYVDLKPGETWALVCQFRDRAGAPKHDKLGMVGTLRVQD